MSPIVLPLHFRPVLLSIFLTALSLFRPLSAEAVIYADQLRALLPTHYKIVEVRAGDRWGHRIDEILLQILKTPTGREFCKATSAEVVKMHRAFFVNSEAAQKAVHICRGSVGSNKHLPFQKKYYLFLTKEEGFKADGWTSPRNETFLFLNENEVSDARLGRSLIHELAVSFDRKDQIGFMAKLDWPRLGLVESPQTCETMALLREPLVKNSLAALRAFQVENQIAQEMGIEIPAGMSLLQDLSCQEKMSFMSSYVEKASEAFLDENLVAMLLYPSVCSHSQNSKQSKEAMWDRLTEMSFQFDDGREISVCEYMTQGLPLMIGTSFMGGPGPRIGGGWKQIEGKFQLSGWEQQIQQFENQTKKFQKKEKRIEKESRGDSGEGLKPSPETADPT